MTFDNIGIAQQYPFYTAGGSGALVGGIVNLNQSIAQRLGVEIGSLPFSPDFGSRLSWLLFKQNDVIASRVGATYIREALAKDGRIQVNQIDYEINGARIDFKIKYQVRATGQIVTYVYPFNRQITR